MNTAEAINATETAALAELLAAGSDHIVRNTAIVVLSNQGMPAKDIAAHAGMHPDTARRIAKTFDPDMSVLFAIEEAASEIRAAEAEALETPATKAKATKAAKAAAAQAAKDAEFETALAPAEDPEHHAERYSPENLPEAAEPEAPAEKRVPKFSVEVDGEHYVTWTRKTRNGDHLTVAQPQALGLEPVGKWVTRCEKHGEIAYADSQKIARDRTAVVFCTACTIEAAQ